MTPTPSPDDAAREILRLKQAAMTAELEWDWDADDFFDFNDGEFLAYVANSAASVAQALLDARAENDSLKRYLGLQRVQIRKLHDATIVLRNGMGGHNHWDHTMKHGAGCLVCIDQQKARNEATRLIEECGPLPEPTEVRDA